MLMVNSEKPLPITIRAIELQPTFAKAFNNRGNVYLAMGRETRAIEDYDEALRHNPSFPAAFNNRGEARAALG